ncbi:MAG: response regulator transcription factor [Rhizobacter sp.]|nr:response regulator transcription factor [Ferruginibacter sp.]
MTLIKIALADDHKIFREGILLELIKFKKVDIILVVENEQVLLDKLTGSRLPDIILMDIRMPILDGIEAPGQIRLLYPEVKIIPLTMYDDKDMIYAFQKMGACGYLAKSTNPDEIFLAIETVFNGDFYFKILDRRDYLL